MKSKYSRGVRLLAGYAKAWIINLLNATGPLERITISLTDRCDSKCSACFIWKNASSASDLPIDILKNLVNSKLFKGAKEIMLTGGEIFLRDDLIEIITLLRANPRTYLTLATNGLQAEKIARTTEILKEKNIAPNRLAVSLDGKPQTNDAIRGVGGSFANAVNSARSARERGLDVSLIFTIAKTNYREILWAYEFAKSEKFEINFYPEISSPRFEKAEAVIFSEKEKEIILDQLEEIFFRRRKHYYFDDSNWHYFLNYFSQTQVTRCDAGRQNIFINTDGRVYPCEGLPGEEFCFGALAEASLDDIWRSSAAKRARDLIWRHRCQPCYISCDIIPSARKKFPSMLWRTLKGRISAAEK